MTYYPGNKKKIGKDLAEIIYEESINIQNEDGFVIKGYCEPFFGMGGVYQHIPELFKSKKIKFVGGDRNPYLIKLWKGLQNGFTPPTKCLKSEYYKYKDEDNTSLKAIFLGFACGFRGVFRSTFNPLINLKLLSDQCKNIGGKLKDVNLQVGDYKQYSNLKGYVIYCDCPYKNTQNAYAIGAVKNNDFNYTQFIDWCMKMSENNIIFISEYTKPCKEASLIWKKDKEKLYVI